MSVLARCKSTDESRCVSRGVQPKAWKHDTVAATSTLHREVAIPIVGHSQGEGDTEFLAADSGATMDEPAPPTVIPLLTRSVISASATRVGIAAAT